MPFKPTIIAKEPIHNFSVEFLTQRLEAERGHVSSSDQQRDAAELSDVRKRFTELTEKSRSLFSNPPIYDAQLSMLSGLASEALTVSKLTDERSATIRGLDAKRFRQDAAHLDLSEPHAGHEPPAERQEADPVDSEQTVPAPQFRRRRRRRRSSRFSAYARKDSP